MSPNRGIAPLRKLSLSNLIRIRGKKTGYCEERYAHCSPPPGNGHSSVRERALRNQEVAITRERKVTAKGRVASCSESHERCHRARVVYKSEYAVRICMHVKMVRWLACVVKKRKSLISRNWNFRKRERFGRILSRAHYRPTEKRA